MRMQALEKAAKSVLDGHMQAEEFKALLVNAVEASFNQGDARKVSELILEYSKPPEKVRTHFIWEQGKERYRVWRDDMPADVFRLINCPSITGQAAVGSFLDQLIEQEPQLFGYDPEEEEESSPPDLNATT